MIRFVDLTPATGATSCAFLDTVTEKFLADAFGDHVFTSDDEVTSLWGTEDLIAECRSLVPEGFWS